VLEIDTQSPFVLTLTILDGASLTEGKVTEKSRVRYCVRDGTVNQTHPDVVSVPTQRIPKSLAQDIIDNGRAAGASGETKLYNSEAVASGEGGGHNPTIFAVESLLSRKMGLGDLLETREVSFSASLAGVHEGIANYENLGTQEGLRMVNLHVVINQGADLLPRETKSYRITDWMEVGKFVEMWEDGKNAKLTGMSAKDAIGVCVQGLCILSTYDILKMLTGASLPTQVD